MKKTFLIITLSVVTWCGFSQTKDLPDPQPYFSAIIVANIDTSLDWYVTNFGFEVLNQVDMADRGFKQANLRRGDALIELIELSTARPPTELLENQLPGTRIQGFFKFGFTVAAFDDWVQILTDAGVNFNGSVVEDQNSGKRMIIVLDPDGNRIQLFEE